MIGEMLPHDGTTVYSSYKRDGHCVPLLEFSDELSPTAIKEYLIKLSFFDALVANVEELLQAGNETYSEKAVLVIDTLNDISRERFIARRAASSFIKKKKKKGATNDAT